ncbi:MAG: wax ester/triacylglycerol synthase family O-acyltransferase [Anaerolineales bacterium]|nr:wax ester/triacylglycerol synthase family O-acyltransferase [Anaerolineales bacterium]
MALRKERMSPVDTAWWHMEEPTNLMMITSVMTFEKVITLDQLHQVIEQRMLRFDRFRQRVIEPRFGIGTLYWEPDPKFDINAHIHHLALPEPGGKAALQDLVSDLMGTPLDYSKPLWQAYLIDSYEGGCAVIFRLHHCIADGIALVRVMLSMTDDSPDAEWWVKTEKKSRRKPGLLRRMTNPAISAAKTTRQVTEAVWDEYTTTLKNPGRLIDATKFGANAAARLGKITLRWPDPQSLYKGPLGTQKRSAWSEAIRLSDVKAIGRVMGGTINDVMATAVSGALRRYLEAHNQPTKGIKLRAYTPVNLRPLDSPIELGNRFGLVYLTLPIGIEDQVERFQEVKRCMDELKDSPEAIVAMGLLSVGGLAPKELQSSVFDFFHTKATAVMTNVPGPRQPIYMAGSRLKYIMAWVPQSGKLGMGISVISYNGGIQVGFNTDSGLVPNPTQLVTFLMQEFEDMLALVHTQELTEV